MKYDNFSRQPNSSEEWKIVDRFNSAYWSGLDVQVYAGNLLLSDAIQVNYVITEQVRPYYGYASYIPDRLYHGTRIIQGEISMNFKKDGYLFSMIKMLREQDKSNIWLPSSPSSQVQANSMSEIRPPAPFNNNAWGPQVSDKLKLEGLDPKVAKDLVMRKKQAASESILNENRFRPDVGSRRGMFETKVEGFDLNIIFGANLNSGMTLRYMEDDTWQNERDPHTYDGAVIQDEGNLAGIVPGTGIKLIGVSIMGIARSVNDDGRPIIETYTFQARDVQVLRNEDIPNGTSKSIHADEIGGLYPLSFENDNIV